MIDSLNNSEVSKMLTQEQAQLICESHEIPQIFENEEEYELLEENNPELLKAYRALVNFAYE